MLDIKLNDILKTNQPVKTQVSKDITWLDNKVLDIEEDSIQLDFIDEYLKLLLTVGDDIKIKLTHDNNEFILLGLVTNILLGNPNKVLIKIEDLISYENLRKYSRCQINLFCKISPSNEEFKIQGITTDISEGGISMVTYADFNIVESVDVELVTLGKKALHFKGKIKRLETKINNHIQYGIEIIEIDEENRNLMNKLIISSNK